nr:hypothetical protein [Tanacetum cinerariifolium]
MSSFNQRPLRGGFCWFCDSRAETSFANDPNPNYFDETQNLSDYPPQPQYDTYPCELCGNDSHYGYDCPPCFDQIQPPQQFVNHQPQEILEVIPFIESKEWITSKNGLYKMMEAYMERINQHLLDLIGMDMNTMLLSINLKSQRLDKEKQEVKKIVEQATKRDEHLSTIPETESDEVIKSSVKNLVPIPSESEVTSDNESEYDVPINDESSPIFTIFSNPLFDCNDDFTFSDDKSLSNEDIPMENFKIYSKPLFDDEEIISTKIDPYYFNAESNLLESLLKRDTLIDSPKFDYLLEEFSGELAHIDPILSGIEEVDFDLDDSHTDEINLFLATDDLMPPGIENGDYDSKGDIHFLEELLSNNPLSLPENESSNF